MLKKLILKLFLSDERFKEVLHGSIYSFSAKIIVSFLGIITSLIGARYYGSEIIGMVSILGTILGVSGLFTGLGMPTSMLRLIPEYREKYCISVAVALYKRILALVLVFAINVAIILFMLSGEIANNIFHNPELMLFISIAAFVLVFHAVNGINIIMIRSLKKIKVFAFFELMPKVISLLLLLSMTYCFFNKYNLIYISFITPILMTVLTSIYIAIYVSSLGEKVSTKIIPSDKKILSLSFPMFLTTGLRDIITQSGIIFLGIFRSASEVGIYSIVVSLAMLTNFMLSSINIIAAPKFSELYHAGKNNELQYVAKKTSKLSFLVTLPILLTFLFFGKEILSLYGEQFVLGKTALLFLVVGQFVNSASGSVGHLLNMTGYQKNFKNIMLASTIFNLTLNWFLIPIYGIDGAAFSSMVTVIFWNIMAVVLIKVRLKLLIAYIPFYQK